MSRAETPQGSVKQSRKVSVRCYEGVDERTVKVRTQGSKKVTEARV